MTGTQSAPSAIAVSGLRKSYGEHTVLDGIDLNIPAGTIFSLLGPNGAGKTTAVQILTTLIRADAGDLWVAGHSVSEEPGAVRSAIGVTGQFSSVDKLFTGQHVGDRDAAAISQRRLRPDGHDAGLAASVHREPADVPGHSDPARAAARRSRRQPRIAVAWCAGIALAGYLWAQAAFNRRAAR
jgi:ABC-type branched-subunit amino acid transport system ATPase component